VTTIAAVQGPDWAVVGFDSRIVGDDRIYTLPKSSGKVVRRDPWLLGAAGDVRAINLVSHVLRPPTPPEGLEGDELDLFFSSKFVPALKKCFDEAQYGEKGEQHSEVVAVVRGRVFLVGSNYEWAPEADGIYAIGSGGSYALGAISQAAKGKSPTPEAAAGWLRSAIAIAARFDVATGGPVRTITQRR